MPALLRALPLQLTLLAFAIALFLAIGSLLLPLGPDQAMFAWIGSVILDGGVPYKDAWDIKGPLTYYVYALAAALFGQQEFAIRILDIAVVASCCWLLRRVVLRLSQDDTFGANCGVILFALMYYAGGYADIAQSDGWGGMAILGAVALLLGPSSRQHLAMAAVGGLIALATLIKPTFLIYILLPCAFGVAPRTVGLRRFWPLVSCLFSFGVVIGAATALLIRAGALQDFLDVLRYLYTTYQGNKRSLLSAFVVLPQTVFQFAFLVPYLLLPIGLWRIRANDSYRSAKLIAAWVVLANATVIVQGRYWQDHMLPAAIATAAVAGVALAYIGRQFFFREQLRLGACALGLCIVLSALAPISARALSRNYQWPSYLAGLHTRAEFVASVTRPFSQVREPFNYMELRRLADYIAQHSQPDDQLVVWGWDVSLFTMSGRRSATRFGVFQPLVEAGAVQDKYRRTFLEEISRHSPRYIIVDTRGLWFYEEGAGLKLLDEFPEFKEFVHSRYKLTSVLGSYEIWTRFR